MLSIGIISAISWICWCLFDAGRKKLAGSLKAWQAAAIVSCGISLCSLSLWIITDAKIDWQPYLEIGLPNLVINVTANLLFFRSMVVAPLSLTIPLLSISPAISVIISALMLYEFPAKIQCIGIGVIILATLLLTRSVHVAENARKQLRAANWMMLGVSLCWGTTTALDKVALRHADPVVHQSIQFFGVGATALLICIVRGEAGFVRALRPLFWPITFALTAGFFAQIMQFIALQHVLVGVFESAKRAIGLTGAMFIGKLYFAEHISRKQLFAVVCMMAGVALLFLEDLVVS